jgi:endonuclease/exonuclease/phosphatase family metal-dependent hydrolase
VTRITGLLAVLLLWGCNSKTKGSAQAKKRVEPVATIAEALGKGHVPSSSPWASRAECERVLEGRKSASLQNGPARIGTWNVRYFPDGSASGEDAARRLDPDWLACSIALLDVDVLAVQEFKSTPRAQASATQLIDSLNRRTGRSYKLDLARCESEQAPRPGILYDSARGSVTSVETAADVSSDKRCTDSEVPALTAYVSLPGGPNFHLIVIHAPAGNQRTAHGKRQASLRALDRLTHQLARSNGDRDIVVTGDFNTSGCKECDPAIDSVTETRSLAESIAGFQSPLRLIPANGTCSFVLDNQPMLLDHFLVAKGMEEVSASATTLVSGYCGAAQCKDVLATADAETRMSDHCPLLLELPRGTRD